MSTLNLDALGLQPDPEAEAQPAPVAPEAPAAPAVPATPAPVEPPVEEEIEIPEGAENPDAVKSLISAERAAARQAYKRAREAEARLAAIEEANMPVEQRLDAVAKRAEAAELRASKLAVGMKHGLSLTFSELLQGSNEEELDKHAQTVLAELGQRNTPAMVPGLTLSGGQQPPPAAPTDAGQAHNNWLLAAINGQLPGA